MTERTEQPEATTATGTPALILWHAVRQALEYANGRWDEWGERAKHVHRMLEEGLSSAEACGHQQPAPVAAGGAGRGERPGSRRWAVLHPNGTLEQVYDAHIDYDFAKRFLGDRIACARRVVPVLVTVLGEGVTRGAVETVADETADVLPDEVAAALGTHSAQCAHQSLMDRAGFFWNVRFDDKPRKAERCAKLIMQVLWPHFARLAAAESARDAAESRAKRLNHEIDAAIADREVAVKQADSLHHALGVTADRLEAAAELLKEAGFGDGAATTLDTVESVRGIAETFKPKESAAASPGAWELISGIVDEVETAEAALGFYADSTNYHRCGEGVAGASAVEHDNGARARAALAAPAGGAAGEGGQAK